MYIYILAFIRDEVSQRILNADGASWVKKVKDKSTCFQLDTFYKNKAVKEKIHNKEARKAVMELLEEPYIEGLFTYLEIYRDSLWSYVKMAEMIYKVTE